MPDFNAQNTDSENSKSAPSSSVRDNDLKVNGVGGIQDIARDRANQNTVTGSGGDPVDASIK